MDVLTKFPSFGLFVGGDGTSHKMIKANVTCSDPGFFCVVGAVVRGRLLENSPNNVFFSFSSTYFIVYREGQIVYQWFYFRGNYFSWFQMGPSFFPGGPSFFQWGPPFSRGGPAFSWVGAIPMLFSIETHITCEFSGGVGPLPPPPPPPLWLLT